VVTFIFQQAGTSSTQFGTGAGWVSYNAQASTINVWVNWDPVLSMSSISSVHIHGPANSENNADVLVTLTVNVNGHNATYSGNTPSNWNATDLMIGRYYFNITHNAAPSGAIRGQIWPATNFFSTHLSTDSIGDGLPGAGQGHCLITNVQARTVRCFVVFIDLSDVTTAHIHGPAYPSVAVPSPMFTLTRGTGAMASTFSLAETTFTDQQLMYLRSGVLYFNISSTSNPSGALRGQIYMSAVNNFFYDGLSTSNCYMEDQNTYARGCVNFQNGLGDLMIMQFSDSACTVATMSLEAPQFLLGSLQQNWVNGVWDFTLSYIYHTRMFTYYGADANTQASNIKSACPTATVTVNTTNMVGVSIPQATCPSFFGPAEYGNVRLADPNTLYITNFRSDASTLGTDFTVQSIYTRNNAVANCPSFFNPPSSSSSSTGSNNNGASSTGSNNNSASAVVPAFALVAALFATVRLF
jgi:hypothetical protein